MDEKTLQALTVLAGKLGVTAEYLWGVLLKQAPITGTVDALLTIALIAAAAWWARFVYRNTTGKDAEWRDGEVAWVTIVIGTIVVAFLVASSLPQTIAALFNPEYWALQQILK